MKAKSVIAQMRCAGNVDVAASSRRYFRLGKGEYAEGDQFLGLRVAQLRALAAENRAMPMAEIMRLLGSSWHEARLLAVFILVDQYRRADDSVRQRIFDAYLANIRFINNWDIVDSSAPQIVGAGCYQGNAGVLERLADSASLWERRIAVLATFYFIRQGRFKDTLLLSKKLLNDPEDLMHKACGWMLKEVGKRDEAILFAFLDSHASTMPRTMLRYALEKTPAVIRSGYMRQKSASSKAP